MIIAGGSTYYGGAWIEITEMLMQAGANANLKGEEGKTVVDWATKLGHNEVIVLVKNHIERQLGQQYRALDLNL